jgi:glutamyl-tRNA synthetase
MHGVDSKCRNRSPAESLATFKEMQEGTEKGLTNCLRFKLDMQNPNKALRDPVAFRCNLTPHWRTGQQYKVGPAAAASCS